MLSKNKGSIGVFDSGFGGLEILREIIKQLPDYDYIYLGDTARSPYGTRSQKIIYKFTSQAVDYLFKQNCRLIILACNTASSKALRKIQREYLPKTYPDRKVLGVLIPAVQEAVLKTKNKKIGIMATEGAVSSRAFVKELKKINQQVQVYQSPAPLLVTIVEAGEQESEITDLALKNYLTPLLKKKIDTLILGCTHYGILKRKIRKIIGNNVNIIVEGKVVAQKLKDYLVRHAEIDQSLTKTAEARFLTTDLSEKFAKLGSLFFGKPIKPQKITLI